jgi:hypothetical protein
MRKRQEWERDLINRQRNFVFPDTVLNEGRFYRNILSRDAEFTHGQRFALVIFGLSLMTGACTALAGSFAELLHHKDWTLVVKIVPFFFLLSFVLIGAGSIVRGVFPPKPSRLARLKSYRHPQR